MKTAIKIIGVLALVYMCIQLFNHINAWAGIFTFIALALIITKYYKKSFK